MIRVYLDQNKWIDLSRARWQRPGGERFQRAYSVALLTSRDKRAEFPLSTSHYVETWRQSQDDRRSRLAQVMIEISGARTMRPPPSFCNSELDVLLARMTGRTPPTVPPAFGKGFPYTSGSDLSLLSVDLDIERRQLGNRPDGFLAYGQGHQLFGDRYRDGEEKLSAGSTSDPPELRDAILAVSSVMEIHENIEAALQRAGADRSLLGALGRVRPDLPPDEVREVLNGALRIAEGFIGELPTRDAALCLRRQRHRNKGNVWESNDMNDIAYLACAVVHCDVIVTEKQWVHELTQSGLLEKYGCRAISDARLLPEAIVGAEAALRGV